MTSGAGHDTQILATAAFSDGHYDTANKGLNRIAVILDANAASG